MASTAYYVQQGSRALAVVSAAVATVGVLVFLGGVVQVAAYEELIEVPTYLSAELVRTGAVLGLALLVAGVVCNILFNTVAHFAAGFRSRGGSAGAGAGVDAAGDGEAGRAAARTGVSTSEQYRRKLEGVYRYMAGLIGFVVVAFVVLAAVVPEPSTTGVTAPNSLDVVSSPGGSWSAGQLLTVIFGVVLYVLFGSIQGAIGAIAVLGGLWYGVRERASEAIVGGFAVALVFLAVGLSARSAGFAIFGLMMVYYNVVALPATELRWLDPASVPPLVRKYVD